MLHAPSFFYSKNFGTNEAALGCAHRKRGEDFEFCSIDLDMR